MTRKNKNKNNKKRQGRRRVNGGGEGGASMNLNPYARIASKLIRTSMACAANLSYNSTTGFNTAGQSLVFAFTQATVQQSIGGGGFGTFGSFTNASDYSNIYDQYRILDITVLIYFSNNNSSINTPATAFPMLYTAIDYDDAGALTSVSEALSYAKSTIIQPGNESGKPGGASKIVIRRPAVQVSALLTNFVGTTAAARIEHSPWLDSDTVNVEHNGLKIYADPVGSFAGSEGYFTFVFQCLHEYKYVK